MRTHTYMMDTFQKSEVISCNMCVNSKKNYFTLGPLTTSATVRKGCRMTGQGPSSFRNAFSKDSSIHLSHEQAISMTHLSFQDN